MPDNTYQVTDEDNRDFERNNLSREQTIAFLEENGISRELAESAIEKAGGPDDMAYQYAGFIIWCEKGDAC